jgi:hypothetical protein
VSALPRLPAIDAGEFAPVRVCFVCAATVLRLVAEPRPAADGVLKPPAERPEKQTTLKPLFVSLV